jgi:ADP-ribosylglycohydrolase
MAYPTIPNFGEKVKDVGFYAELMHEYGAEGIQAIIDKFNAQMEETVAEIAALPINQELKAREPDCLNEIRALRTDGPRRLWKSFDEEKYREKLRGAFYARAAGCTLGSIVEFWPPETMEKWAEYTGGDFPPTDYWPAITNPIDLRYGKCPREMYTRDKMDGIPVDDDIAYTLLGLLIAEDHGIDFTVDSVGAAWVKYLPYACTAEAVALENLKKGIAPMDAAIPNNPFVQWIGADIRSDPFAYMAPGYPEYAAKMAYTDAYVSHRRNGIYGEMFFAAAQAAAFEVDNPIDALKIGLTEIPRDCTLYRDVVWALEAGKSVKNHKDAVAVMEERFKGMSGVHTNNNAVLTIFGLMIGQLDVTRVISELIAMSYDNDCTAATAGSIVGAIVGAKGVPAHWYKNFNNKVHSYLNGPDTFVLDDILDRYEVQAKKVLGSK